LQGREFILAPYTLGALRRAAPYIDKVNAAALSCTSFGDRIAMSLDLLAVVAIGLEQSDLGCTAERLAEDMSPAVIPELEVAYHCILAEAGFSGANGSTARDSNSSEPLAEQLDELIVFLVAAGVEGGSLRRIENEWTLAQVHRLQAHWRAFGPPAHIALAVIAASLGNKITSDAQTHEAEQRDEIMDLIASLPMTVVQPIEAGHAAWQREQILRRRNNNDAAAGSETAIETDKLPPTPALHPDVEAAQIAAILARPAAENGPSSTPPTAPSYGDNSYER
jgi:hypothetical protein